VGCSDQDDFLKRSTKVTAPELPTAVQAVRDVHETPLSTPAFRVRMIDHRAPFNRSISGPPRLRDPTARHAVADVHDTPLRELITEPAGVAIRSIDQREPFHRSTSARRCPTRVV
jgi:hypothetical protein